MNDIGISTRKPDPVARARALGPAIAAVVDEIERSQAIPEPVLGQLHVGAAVSHAVATCRWMAMWSSRGPMCWRSRRRRGSMARSAGAPVDRQQHRTDCRLYGPFASAREIWGDPRAAVAWGPPNEHKAIAVPGGYEVTGRWISLVGLPPLDLDGRAWAGGRAGWLVAAQPRRGEPTLKKLAHSLGREFGDPAG